MEDGGVSDSGGEIREGSVEVCFGDKYVELVGGGGVEARFVEGEGGGGAGEISVEGGDGSGSGKEVEGRSVEVCPVEGGDVLRSMHYTVSLCVKGEAQKQY